MTEPYFPPVVDSSMLAAFKSCPTLFRYQYIEGHTSRFPSPHLHAGGAFAHALEATRRAYYVVGHPPADAIAAGEAAMRAFWGDFVPPPQVAKTLERMLGAFQFYWTNYPLTDDSCTPIVLPSGARGIEFSFAHPLPIPHPITGDPLIYCGRMDAIMSAYGGVFNLDDKTTSSLGPTWSRQWDLRSQFIGYAWGARASGLDVTGTIVRGVSILKTKYETQQAIVYSPEWLVERWFEELIATIMDMIECWSRDRWRHNLDHACTDYGGCQFMPCCTVQQPTSQLETLFRRARWNPLTRQTVEIAP
jgi:hypothetical protein